MNMRTLAYRSVRANPVRFIATVLAVVVGTGFLAGTLILKDSLNTSLDANIRGQLAGVDAAVLGEGTAPDGAAGGATTGTSPSGTVSPGSATPGSAAPTSTQVAGTPPTTRGSNGGGGGTNAATGRERTRGVNKNVPASVLDTVKATPGVRVADGVLTGLVNTLQTNGDVINDNAQGYRWITEPDLNPYRIVEGRGPTAANEVAVDRKTFSDAGLAIGGSIRLATLDGAQQATIVGVATYGTADSSSSAGDVLVSDADAFAWLNAGNEQFSAIYVAATPGTPPDQLVANLQRTVGSGYTVETGDQLRADASGGLSGIANTIGTGLQVFAYIAMFVSIFIIYNTFSIVVAQRTREFALLRALGARGGQVVRSVMVEAIILGFVAAVLGVLLGIVFFLIVSMAVPQVKDIAGTVSLTVRPGAVGQTLLVGVAVTLLSAIFPAIRAARTKPIEAMREIAVDRAGRGRIRAGIGVTVLGLGALMLVLGAFGDSFLLMVAGLVPLFLGFLVAAPAVAASFGWLVDLVPGVQRFPTSRLGIANVRRNPKRAATTTNALVIGVFLVVGVAAGGGSLRDFAVDRLSELTGPDLTIVSLGTGFSPEYVDAVNDTPGVTAASPAYQVGTLRGSGGGGIPVGAIDTQGITTYGFNLQSGSFSGFGPGSIVLSQFVAQATGSTLGSQVTVQYGNGVSQTYDVIAIVETSVTGIFQLPAFVDSQGALQIDPALTPVSLAITTEAGKTDQVSDALDELNKTYSSVFVLPGNFFAQAIKTVFNFLISAVSALLSVAVVIALFGIVNTLVLSVSERRHEIGLLRAVGMTRAQVRGTVRLEALVVALLGSAVGILFGLFVAWCFTHPILNSGTNHAGFTWPVLALVVTLVLSVVLGVMASLIPAWRAARLNIIEAVTVE